MSTRVRDLRGFAAIPLSIYLVVAGIAMWTFNPVSQQNQFGALLGSEFFTIAMLFYVFLHEDFGKPAVLLFSTWLFAIAIMLSIAFI